MVSRASAHSRLISALLGSASWADLRYVNWHSTCPNSRHALEMSTSVEVSHGLIFSTSSPALMRPGQSFFRLAFRMPGLLAVTRMLASVLPFLLLLYLRWRFPR